MTDFKEVARLVRGHLTTAEEEGYADFLGKYSDEELAFDLWHVAGSDYPSLCDTIEDLEECVRRVRLSEQ